MLLRMYTRWSEGRGGDVDVLDYMPGEEAGVKSVTLQISAARAFGWLRSERGVHRLIRLSPFDAAHRRHTSFALVEVLPVVETDVEVEIHPKDVQIDTYRSQGAGGQHVNKTDSAVRITHKPTGIVVTCQNERSQIQNRELAMRILGGRLLELRMREIEEQQARLRGEHITAGWGNQIRNYVLHPYTMVRDLRSGQETGNAQAVLDGDLDPFMRAYLEWHVGQTSGPGGGK